ncbi:hypothetical protein [Spirosoma validum]|uniref:Prevent-host-death family protein n=1 Tax=Spirosoma validum TaxID=2771355 RepID=A0A927GBK6_9BACT|nr:hypothetical protein [Spirosoma validum]MBD2751496.1 hypothetical protein [Spirosoma validum]
MKPQFITDEKGNRTGVILPINDFNKLLEELDENHTAHLYDKAKEEKLTFRPLNDVLKEVEAKRTKRRVSGSDQ